ncbi:MAG: chemotaxis protein CheX [Candidatus Dormiibacterota bacterium]
MSTVMNSESAMLVPIDPQWRMILEGAALEVFQMMAGTTLTPQSDPSGEPRGELTAMVGMAGALCGMALVRCSEQAAAHFTALMLGGEGGLNSSVICDALGEICNMVAGNFKAKISALADQCLLSVPTVISGGTYTLQTLEPSQEIHLEFAFEGAPVWVSLLIHSCPALQMADAPPA